jgi:hypothetical protein
MSSKSSLARAQRFLDERNIRIINQNPIGTKVYLDYINPEGKLIKYETIVTIGNGGWFNTCLTSQEMADTVALNT